VCGAHPGLLSLGCSGIITVLIVFRQMWPGNLNKKVHITLAQGTSLRHSCPTAFVSLDLLQSGPSQWGYHSPPPSPVKE
jgi:hypothetical protein